MRPATPFLVLGIDLVPDTLDKRVQAPCRLCSLFGSHVHAEQGMPWLCRRVHAVAQAGAEGCCRVSIVSPT
jgi:hypothetical protein